MSAFFFREYRRVLSSRPARLAMFAMAYGLLSFPVVVAKPPPEIRAALQTWFGMDDFASKLTLFAWFDLVMNKLAVFSAAILAAGIITDERSKQTLDIFLSKPVTLRRYFVVKALAAAATLMTLYAGVTLLAVLYFSFMLPGFAVAPFVKMSAVHVFAAAFAAYFAALMAVSFQRKLSALLTSIFGLSSLVGLAFGAFYQPAWRAVFAFNPMSQGVSLIATAETATVADMARPIFILIVMCVSVLAMGAYRAGRMEDAS